MMARKKQQDVKKKRKSAGQFCKVYMNVIRELYHDYKTATAGILLLSLILVNADFVELKLLEYATNSVSAYLAGTQISFRRIAAVMGIFGAALLTFRILSGIYHLLYEKYQSRVKLAIEKKIVRKLSSIRYEYYESNAFYEKINLARQAGDQYSNAVYGVSWLADIVLRLLIYGWMLSRVSLWFAGLLFLSVAVCSVVAALVTDRQLAYWSSHVSPETRRKSYFMNVFANRVNHQNIQTGRSFPYFTDKFQYFTKRERKNYLKLNLLSVSTDLTTSSLFLIAFFITAIIVGNGVASGKYEIGYFTMVIALLDNLFETIKSFAMFIMKEDWYVKILEAYYDVLELCEDDRAVMLTDGTHADDGTETPRTEMLADGRTALLTDRAHADGEAETPRTKTLDDGRTNLPTDRTHADGTAEQTRTDILADGRTALLTDGTELLRDDITVNTAVPCEDRIVLKRLCYQYMQSQDYALRNVNLTLRKGEKIALVGENGSGKTTLISILSGLLNQYEGTCKRNGFIFTSVLQDFGQYQMTVKENIEVGCGGKELSEEAVCDILKKVELHDFILSKPDGIYTRLGQLEEGIELSKGQWQRLAVGRLLARPEANVWILDEPTAYLDPLAEITMYKTIFDLSGDKTVLFISHRLGFAKNADRILVAAHGSIVEDGTHQSLICKEDGYYARMYKSQREWYA